MTYKEKVKWMERYQAALRKERFFEEEIEELRSDAERMTTRLTGLPGGGMNVNRTEKCVERIVAAQEKLEAQVQQCMDIRCEVAAQIAEVRHDAGREVLRRRYILGEGYPEIMDAMNLAPARVYKLHHLGLESVLNGDAGTV